MNKIGRYAIERRIGAGSFATVWQGHDEDLDVPVAVKVLAENWAANDDVRHRFLAEARIMRRIHDPRLVQVYDIGTLDDGRPYFVMDYIDGGSLNERRKAGLDPVEALRLCVEACRALEVLHTNDIIHRDVTPGNLLITAGPGGLERVLIADLGVAKSMIDAVGATMTAGTPSYMAPEQAAGSMPLDRRADIYSLTAVTYAMLTGRPPFPVGSISDILSRDTSLQPEPIADRVQAPASLDAVMISGLAFDRNRRPPTALLLADGLTTIADQIESGRSGPLRPAPPAPAVPNSSSPTRPIHLPEATLGTMATPLGQPSGPQHHPSAPQHQPSGPQHQPSAPGPSARPTPAPVAQITDPQAFRSYVPGYDQPAAYDATSRPDPVALPGAQRRGTSYYVMLGIGALALFAISMFVTILLLR